MGIIDIFMTIFDPFKIYRKFIWKPILNLLFESQEHFGSKTKNGLIAGRKTFLKLACVFVGAVIILWASVFMYIGFYYAYMPSIDHLKPVHMQFQ